MYLHIHSLLSSYTFKYLNWSPKSDTNRCCRVESFDLIHVSLVLRTHSMNWLFISLSVDLLVWSHHKQIQLNRWLLVQIWGLLRWMRRSWIIINCDIGQNVRRIIYYNIWQHIRRIINWHRWSVGLRSMAQCSWIWDRKLPRPMLPIQMYMRLLSNDKNENENENDKNRKRDENDSESG